MNQDIYDNRRRRIGRVQVRASGIRDIFDDHGNRLGEYRPTEGRTYDAHGNVVGYGDQLTRFLR